MPKAKIFVSLKKFYPPILGNRTSHTISWNTGALTILAFGGRRTSDITRRYLLATNKYQQFYQLCEHRYIAIFDNDTLDGDGLSFALPSRSLPKVANYELCDANVQSNERSSQFCIDGDHCCKQAKKKMA